MWLYYSRFLFWWEEGGGGERTPEPGMLSGLRLRRGQPRISSPPAEADQTASPARAVRFKAVGLGWLGGNWMSRQRCAGRRGGKAEFPCGLMGRGWAEALRCRLGVCRGASLSSGGGPNCGGIFGWVLRDFFSGVWYGWYIL